MPDHPLFPNVRRSPYEPRTDAAGCTAAMAYNHMYMPMAYGRDPAVEYRALTEAVVLWDVAAERQVELLGPDALGLADRLVTRDLSRLPPGRCRYGLVCDPDGLVLCDPVVLHVAEGRLWLSHGNMDLLHWARGIAHGSGLDVRVSEADVPPLQVQGPRSREVLRPLVGDIVDRLRYYGLADAEIAGEAVVVSRTGWSCELGFEVFPRRSARALAIWDAIAEAGAPHGLLVTGPNVVRAVECGIRDTTWATGMGATGLELDGGRWCDLDAGDFVGREALLAERARGPRRVTVGLAGDGPPPPRSDGPWPLLDGGREVGATRWCVRSERLGRTLAIGLVEAGRGAVGTPLTMRRPDLEENVEVVPLPFLGAVPGARD